MLVDKFSLYDLPAKSVCFQILIMGVAKKVHGLDSDNCSTGSEYWYGSKLVISGVKRLLERSDKMCQINTVWLPTVLIVNSNKLF